MTTRLRRWMVPLVGLLLAAPVDAGAFDLLRNEEATIADIHAALSARTLTCRGLVQMYLDRIEALNLQRMPPRRSSSWRSTVSTRSSIRRGPFLRA